MTVKARDQLKVGVGLLLRIGVSTALMAWLVSVMDVNRFIEQWTKANWMLIGGLPGIQFACFGLRAVRQRLILKRLGLELRLWWLVIVQWRANFFRSFVPGGIGGDIYKACSVARTTETRTQPVVAVFVERLFGVGSMLLLSLLTLFYSAHWLEASVFHRLSWPVIGASLMFVLLNLLLVLGIRARLTVKALEAYRPFKFGREVGEQLVLFLRGTEVLKLTALSLVIQMMVVIWYFTISMALGLNVGLQTYMIIIPIVEIFLMLPISIAGIGVRDGALVILLALFGVPAVSALSLSVASLVAATVLNIVAGVGFWFKIDPNQRINLRVDAVEVP